MVSGLIMLQAGWMSEKVQNGVVIQAQPILQQFQQMENIW